MLYKNMPLLFISEVLRGGSKLLYGHGSQPSPTGKRNICTSRRENTGLPTGRTDTELCCIMQEYPAFMITHFRF